MKTEMITCTISGKGDSRDRALSDVFRQVPDSVRAKASGTCFRIQPVELEVTSAVEFRKREKFLGFLFARTRTEFRLTARVVVEVSSINLEDVNFVVKDESLSVAQHLLQLR